MAKFDMYATVTQRIIEMLENGIIPWEKPWTGGFGAWSRATGKHYALINQFLLEPGEYVTFENMAEEGGKLKPDDEGNMPKAKQVWEFYYKVVEKEELDENGEHKKVILPKCKYTRVFNVEKDTTLAVKHTKRVEPSEGVEPIERLESIISGYLETSGRGLTFSERTSDSAVYTPILDLVVVPKKRQFTEVAEFYSTAFHELAHSTGHPSRLNRFKLDSVSCFGSDDYSREELVAELTACSILANTGVETRASFRNNAAYIQNWVAALKEDNKAIIRAAAKAEAAFYMIMGMENPRNAEPNDADIEE